MVTLEIRRPDSLHERLRFAAEQQGISTAITEKVSALESETLLLERAREGSRVEPMFVVSMHASHPCAQGATRDAKRVFGRAHQSPQ